MACLLAGCASNPKPKPVYEVGWIGGKYERAKSQRTFGDWWHGTPNTVICFPKALQPDRTAGILVLGLRTNRPAFRAGLREGDLILDAGSRPVTNLPCFWRTVRNAKPGSSLPLKVYRDGKTLDLSATVGRERYEKEGNLTIGLPFFWDWLHLIPGRLHPEFSLIVLGWKGGSGRPAELDTVEQDYRRTCDPKSKPEGHEEEWKTWLAIVQVTKDRKVIAQEPVTTASTVPAARGQ